MAFFAACMLFRCLTAAVGVGGTELVPERYLRPRDFNHHPFTDVGDGSYKQQSVLSDDVHPYAILASKRPREGREFPDDGGNVLYPNPPAEVLPRKHALQVHLQELPVQHVQQIQPEQHAHAHYDNDPYNVIPKNYAFSYSVKDKHSGDDFSHSQAHNGKATRGQYRVKLPDGRVQVVSYTADHHGYKADVQYEGEAHGAPHQAPYQPPQHTYQAVTPIYQHTTPAAEHYGHYAQPQYQQYHTATPAPYAFSPTPTPYHQESYSATPSYQQYSPSPYSPYPSQGYRQLYEESYASPPSNHIYPSPTPPPPDNSASPSPVTFPSQAPEQPTYAQTPGLQAYASPSPSYASPSPSYPSPSPSYESSGFESAYGNSPSPFAVQAHLRSTPAPFARPHYITPTESSGFGHIIVTPRSQRSSNPKEASRRVFGARENVIYRYKSKGSK